MKVTEHFGFHRHRFCKHTLTQAQNHSIALAFAYTLALARANSLEHTSIILTLCMFDLCALMFCAKNKLRELHSSSLTVTVESAIVAARTLDIGQSVDCCVLHDVRIEESSIDSGCILHRNST